MLFVLGPRMSFGAADELVLSYDDVAQRPKVGPWRLRRLRPDAKQARRLGLACLRSEEKLLT